MPLEALRYPVTPVGLHYLLIHYDVPIVDTGGLAAHCSAGSVSSRSGSTSCAPGRRVELTVTMECAGNGRARLEPPAGQPAVAARGGRHRPLEGNAAAARCSRRPGIGDGAVEVLFTGLDRGVEGGEEQQFQRSLPLDEALGDEVLLAYEMNGAPLPPQHGFPLRLVVPGWYGMTNVKWLERIERARPAVRRLPAGAGLPAAAERGRGGRAAASGCCRAR